MHAEPPPLCAKPDRSCGFSCMLPVDFGHTLGELVLRRRQLRFSSSERNALGHGVTEDVVERDYVDCPRAQGFAGLRICDDVIRRAHINKRASAEAGCRSREQQATAPRDHWWVASSHFCSKGRTKQRGRVLEQNFGRTWLG